MHVPPKLVNKINIILVQGICLSNSNKSQKKKKKKKKKERKKEKGLEISLSKKHSPFGCTRVPKVKYAV